MMRGIAEKLARHKSQRPNSSSKPVTRFCVQIHAPANGCKGRSATGKQTGYGTCEDISGSGGCETYIAFAAHDRRVMRRSDESPSAFQSHDRVQIMRSLLGDRSRIGLHLRPCNAHKAGHLTCMRGEHYALVATSRPAQAFDGARIDYDGELWRACMQHRRREALDCALILQSWSDQHSIGLCQMRRQPIDCAWINSTFRRFGEPEHQRFGIAIPIARAFRAQVAICSRPAPARRAAVPASNAAPGTCSPPAMTSTFPRAFLSPSSDRAAASGAKIRA